MNDGDCVAIIMESILDEFCLEECNVFIISVNIICLNNGMLFNGNDDQFFVILIVNGSNISNFWNGIGGVSGFYGMLVFFGLFLISMGQVFILVNDLNDLSCNVFVFVIVLLFCIDCEVMLELLSIDCDDNGILVDFFDDLYYVMVEVSSQGVILSFGWCYWVLFMGSYVGYFLYDQFV